MKRYISTKRHLTQVERHALHQATVKEAEELLAEAKKALEFAIKSEPPLTTTEYIEVKPGDPQYEEAHFENTIMAVGKAIVSDYNRGSYRPTRNKR